MAKQVTVVIPTVDRPALLTQAVASVLAQDWPDLHVIVVFDGAPVRSIIDDDRVSVASTGHERLGGGYGPLLGSGAGCRRQRL